MDADLSVSYILSNVTYYLKYENLKCERVLENEQASLANIYFVFQVNRLLPLKYFLCNEETNN